MIFSSDLNSLFFLVFKKLINKNYDISGYPVLPVDPIHDVSSINPALVITVFLMGW